MTSEAVTLARRYSLDDRIAGGGMGTVWRATDQILARTVAVKILHPSLSDNEQFIQRFKREAFSAARLTHPNIVSIYDTGQEAAFDDSVRYYIVMEYCSRGTLAAVLEGQGSLDPSRACRVGETICEALAYAHRNGVVHRDIKPENVLVAEDGSLKVADFGIAKAAFGLGDITTTGVILGTVTHISPEQAKGLEPDARSDLYALGVLLYQLLVGRPPFKAESDLATAMQHIKDEPPPLRSVKASIPKAVEAVVLGALAKEPDDRYQTAEDLRSALQGAIRRSRSGSHSSTAVLEASRSSGPDRRGAPAAPDTGRSVTTGQVSEGSSRAVAPPSTGARSLIAVGLLVALAILAAVVMANRTGAPPGTAGNQGEGGTGDDSTGGRSRSRIEVAQVADFDPYGDTEHPDETALANDGDDTTEWTTESYTSSLAALKPGVGLVFDLGRPQSVDRFALSTSTPGYAFELREAATVGDDETGFTVVKRSKAATTTRLGFPPKEARYWLVWITELPEGDGGSASISEVRFFGG